MDFRASNFDDTRFLAFSVIFFASVGLFFSLSMAFASFAGSRGWTSRPDLWCWMISGMPPVSEAITGIPIAMASMAVYGHASHRDGIARQSSELYMYSGFSVCSENRKYSDKEYLSTIFFAAICIGPEPAMTNRKFVCF